jgi:DNA-binding transcriptional LysR family regulator
MIDAAISGYGIAYVPEDLVSEHISTRRLILLLDEWSHPFSGYHLYYPSRRQLSPAMRVIADALRHNAQADQPRRRSSSPAHASGR